MRILVSSDVAEELVDLGTLLEHSKQEDLTLHVHAPRGVPTSPPIELLAGLNRHGFDAASF